MPAPPVPATPPATDRFAVCLAHLLRIEGGFVNRPQDSGGATNFGISLRFLTEHAGNPVLTGIVGSGPYLSTHVRFLDREQATAIYRHFFWDANLCGEMPAPLDGAVFDQCVNGGGAVLLQRTLNLFYHGALDETGEIGGKTLQLVSRAAGDRQVGVERLLTSFRTVAENHYRDIVRRNKSQMLFLSGWVTRARRLGDV